MSILVVSVTFVVHAFPLLIFKYITCVCVPFREMPMSECVWFRFCSCFCASWVVAAYFLICPRKLCSDLMFDGISTVGSLWSHCPYVKCVPPEKTWICFCLDVAIWVGIFPLILSISVKIKTGSIPESAFSRPPTEDAVPQSPDFVAPRRDLPLTLPRPRLLFHPNETLCTQVPTAKRQWTPSRRWLTPRMQGTQGCCRQLSRSLTVPTVGSREHALWCKQLLPQLCRKSHRAKLPHRAF